MNALALDPPQAQKSVLPHPELDLVAKMLPSVLGVRTDHRRIPDTGDQLRVAVLRGANSDRKGDLQVGLTDVEPFATHAVQRIVKAYGLSMEDAHTVRNALIALSDINDDGSWALKSGDNRGPVVGQGRMPGGPYDAQMAASIARLGMLLPAVATIHIDMVYTDPTRRRGRNDWVRFVARSGKELAAVFWRDLMPAIRVCAYGAKDPRERDIAVGHVRKFAKQLGVPEAQAVEAIAELQMWVMVYEPRMIRLG